MRTPKTAEEKRARAELARAAACRELPEIATVEEVAAWLRIGAATVRRLVKLGELPGAKLGRRIWFSRALLVAWLRDEWPCDPKAAECICHRCARYGEAPCEYREQATANTCKLFKLRESIAAFEGA